jgi:hypothetical protein
MAQTYLCKNKACTLGSQQSPGRFSGGITKEQVTLLTGNPEPSSDEYGSGVCPNCGKPGTKE